MAQPNESGKQDTVTQVPEAPISAPMPRKVPIWVDEVDEVHVFSDLKEGESPKDAASNGK